MIRRVLRNHGSQPSGLGRGPEMGRALPSAAQALFLLLTRLHMVELGMIEGPPSSPPCSAISCRDLSPLQLQKGVSLQVDHPTPD